MGELSRIRIECPTCGFNRTFTSDGSADPSEVVREHGRTTGHKVSIVTE